MVIISARGIVLDGFLTSPLGMTIPSKPVNMNTARAIATAIPVQPKGMNGVKLLKFR